MKVLVLDPASTSGYCIFEYDKNKASANIINWGFIEVVKSEIEGERYVDFSTKIEKLIKDNNIEDVAFRGFLLLTKNSTGCKSQLCL